MQVSHARALMQSALVRGIYSMQASRALGTCASSHATVEAHMQTAHARGTYVPLCAGGTQE